MPKRQRYRQYKKKKRIRKPKQSGFVKFANTAVKALNIATSVARLLNVEHKNHDYNNGPSDASGTSPSILWLSDIPEGTGPHDRNGRQVKATSLHLKGKFIKGSATPDGTIGRLILVRYQENQAPIYSDINSNAAGVTVLDHRNIANHKNYTILMDRTYMFEANKSNYFMVDKYVKLDDRIRFADDDTQVNNHYYLMAYSNTSTATEMPRYTIRVRLQFVDN